MLKPLIRLLAAAPLALHAAAVFAQVKAPAKGEEPIQAVDPSGVMIFGVVVLILIVVFVALMYVNSKKKPEEREGDKF
jgi:hypothetical protein